MMTERKDIANLTDVELLVHTFYGKIRIDALLGPIFNGVIKDRWDDHLEKMCRFWQTVLLDEHTYYGSPFPPHAQLPLEQKHFDTWQKLWSQTVDEHFSGANADLAKLQADRLAAAFLSKIRYYQNNYFIQTP